MVYAVCYMVWFCAELYFIFVMFLCGISMCSSILVMYLHNRSAADDESSLVMSPWVSVAWRY